jgi:hypothetical protein
MRRVLCVGIGLILLAQVATGPSVPAAEAPAVGAEAFVFKPVFKAGTSVVVSDKFVWSMELAPTGSDWLPAKVDMLMEVSLKFPAAAPSTSSGRGESVRSPAADPGLEVEIGMRHIRTSMTLGISSLVVDTDDPKTLVGLQGETAQAMMVLAAKAGLDERGLVKRFDLDQERITKKMEETTGGKLPEASSAKTMAQLKTELSGMLDTISFYLPGRPVVVGETWKTEREVIIAPLGGDNKVAEKVECTLKEVKPAGSGRIAVIALKGTCERAKTETVTAKTFELTGQVTYNLDRSELVACHVEIKGEGAVEDKKTPKTRNLHLVTDLSLKPDTEKPK